MYAFLICATVLAVGNAEHTKADAHFRVYPVYAHAGVLGSLSKASLLQQIPRPQPPPPNPPPPPPPPQPQPQQDPLDPFKPPVNPANPEPLEPYKPPNPYNPEQQIPQQPQAPVQPQPQPHPQAPVHPEPQQEQEPQPQPQEPRRGFNVKDIEHKPIFVFTTTDYKSYDIVYASEGIGGLNSDPATKYIADFLIANDTEKLVIVFNYLNFPFSKLPDLPISRLILPNNLKLSFFSEPSVDIPIVVIFTKEQLTALDNYVQTSHVSLVGEIKLPKPATSPKIRIIHQ